MMLDSESRSVLGRFAVQVNGGGTGSGSYTSTSYVNHLSHFYDLKVSGCSGILLRDEDQEENLNKERPDLCKSKHLLEAYALYKYIHECLLAKENVLSAEISRTIKSESSLAIAFNVTSCARLFVVAVAAAAGAVAV
uniref:Uncharacterized protein n=1 Tax=Glossina pallidipes TaxID=7398 RepID=A0A1A9ZIY4_GLOPL